MPRCHLGLPSDSTLMLCETGTSASATLLLHSNKLSVVASHFAIHGVALCGEGSCYRAIMTKQPLKMTASSIIDSTANRSRFLEGLTESDRIMVLAAASKRCLKAGSVALHQGDPGDHLFLILNGRARYFYITPQGKKIILLWLTEGQIFGGSALLATPSDYLVGTELVRDSCLLVWPRRTIRSLAVHVPRLLDNALSIATDYLTWYLAAHASLTSQTAEQRLAHVLVTLAQGFGHKTSAGTSLELTNEQLANTANVTPFTASRILSSWQRKGAVSKTRGQLVLRSPMQLFLCRS